MSRSVTIARLPRRTSLAGAAAGLVLASLLGGCHANRVVESTYPNAYAERHPIRIAEGAAVHEVLVGTGRGSLTPVQRAELTAFAGSWRRRGSGGLVIEVPAGTTNELAAGVAAREVRSILAAAGVPAAAVTMQPYQPDPLNTMAPVRVVYPTVKAEAGPCGIWPDDLGVQDGFHQAENRPYWNLGCANQKAFAAMIDNPADLVQPRREQPAYGPRRQTVFDKYQQGQSTATKGEEKDSKLSKVGAQ